MSAARDARWLARRLAGRVRRRGRPVPDLPKVPQSLLELRRRGPSALLPGPADAERPLHVAAVIPSFRRGSGGHATIVHLLRELSLRGHRITLWLDDWEGRHHAEGAAATRRSFAEYFAADDIPLRTDLGRFDGADVVLATGWHTVPAVLMLPRAHARAYLVQDHEPEFYGTSAQALFAAQSYGAGLHCIAASPWLAALLRDRYGAAATHFDLAVDHEVYRPGTDPRRRDLVVFYARSATERRAVPLGLLALHELARRRPMVEIALFGGDRPAPAPFRHTDRGVQPPPALADLYRRATLGMVFSMTNPSLVGLEMMASGLPCLELASEAMLQTFGSDGPLCLATADPWELSSTIEALLEDSRRREQMAERGLVLTRERTWRRAAEQVEHGLRCALSATSD